MTPVLERGFWWDIYKKIIFVYTVALQFYDGFISVVNEFSSSECITKIY